MGQALRCEEGGYIENLHSNSKGWITKAQINGGYKQWHYKFKDLILQDFDKENVYMSMNTFYSTFRRLEYLKELKAHFIDLDIYKTKYTKEQALMHLEAEYFNQSIPRPNFIIDSGRGLYLIWLINSVPSKALPLWKAVEDYLYRELKEFGADSQALDPTRILRVPGSINSKTNTVVKVLEEYDYIYDLREIQHNFLPELSPAKEKKRGRPSKVIHVHRERSLYYARIQDIAKLCELRDYDLKGHREFILFLYRYYLCAFTNDVKKALNDVLELNSMFRYPLSIREATGATRSAETCYLSNNKEYRYRNDTLIEKLQITDEEQFYMSTIISKNEFKRRKNIRDREYQKNKYQEDLKAQGKLSEKDKISVRRQKIKDLIAEGLKQKDIYSLLQISKRTCINDINYLKEQGLI